MAKVFVGVAWPYANGPIHLGHVAGCYLPPDIFARYHRMAGDEVLMVSGSDMHGTPVTVKADEEGVQPAVVAQRYHELNARTFERFGISFDLYLSTEDATHKKVAQAMFLRLHERGFLYEKEAELPYCPKCERTLPDRYIEGTCPHCGSATARGDQCPDCGKLLDPDMLSSPRCKTCGTAPTFVKRRHFFFKLSALEPRLKEWVKDKSYWRPHVFNFTNTFLESGLKDRPVTRDTTWGIEVPLPGNEGRRIYVWFEAFMGYYSMAVEWARRKGKPEAWREFWQDPACRHYYFLGKDNVPFHTIFWPAVLMAHGELNLPYDVPANAMFKFGGEQFSKSRGVSIDLDDAVARYNVDAVRYYIASIMPENRDTDFSWAGLVAANNNELVATLGNFVHRALTFTEKNFGAVPELGELDEADKAALAAIERASKLAAGHIAKCQFKDGLRAAMDLAREGNRYFDTKGPWALIKSDRAKCATALHVSLRFAKALAVLTMPYTPHGATRMWGALGLDGEPMRWAQATEPLTAGARLPKPQVIFSKFEEEGKMEQRSPLAIMDIRVGKTTSVLDHPNAEKLYVMNVDVGETRQIVSGLRGHYTIDELAGKRLLVICNLQPAKLRGIDSNGMLLAADDDGLVSCLVPPEGAQPGTKVDGCEGTETIDYKKFQSVVMIAGRRTGDKVDIGRPMGNAPQSMPEGAVVPCAITQDMKLAVPITVGGKAATFDKPVPPGAKVK
jgi:methionyl-tRNA synthetase